VAELLAKAGAADQADVPDGMSFPDELSRPGRSGWRSLPPPVRRSRHVPRGRFERDQAAYQAKLAEPDATAEAPRRIDIDVFIGQQPVDRLDGILGHQATRQRKPLTDRVDWQGGGSNDAEGGVGQGQDPLGVHVAIAQAGEATVHLREAEGLDRLHRWPRES